MILYVSKKFTDTFIGERIIPVSCDKCRTPFFYKLQRTGVGTGTAHYFLFQDRARRNARIAAEADAQWRLESEAELVPCPKCNWVNEDAIRKQRSRVFRSAPWIATAFIVAGLMAGPAIGLVLTFQWGPTSSWPVRVGAIIAVGGLAIGVVTLLHRRQAQRRIDPNGTYPRRPVLPLGTPPALVERRHPVTGAVTLEAVHPPRDEAAGAATEWATLRVGSFVFPDLCCVCLAPATRAYAPPIKANETSDLPIPICDACQSRCRRAWWRVWVNGTTAIALLCLALTFLPFGDAVGRWVVASILALVGTVAAAIIAGTRTRPYRLVVMDDDRGVVRFRADNPAFTRLTAASDDEMP